MLPAQIHDQLVILVDTGSCLLDEGHDPAERPEDKPVRTAGGAAAPLCSHCGVITMSMGSQLSAGPQSLQIIDVSENEEDVFTLRVGLKQPGRRRRKEGRRRRKEEEEKEKQEEAEAEPLTVFWLKVTLI